jgi:hypothetical protein
MELASSVRRRRNSGVQAKTRRPVPSRLSARIGSSE